VTDFAGFSDAAYDFYAGLLMDNSKSYWTAHKHVYEDAVRAPMQTLLDSLAAEFDAEVSLFRPYRDIRFSKDKSPYKIHQGAFLDKAPGVGYYISLGAEGVHIGGGFHAHDRDQTARYRAAVDDAEGGSALVGIVARLEKQGFAIGGEQVRTRPRGVPADHPRLDLMRREFVTAGRPIDVSEADGAALRSVVRKDWRKLTPLVEWVMEHAPPTADS
jgi:uncharacterized protein (TIGR02453 family)